MITKHIAIVLMISTSISMAADLKTKNEPQTQNKHEHGISIHNQPKPKRSVTHDTSKHVVLVHLAGRIKIISVQAQAQPSGYLD